MAPRGVNTGVQPSVLASPTVVSSAATRALRQGFGADPVTPRRIFELLSQIQDRYPVWLWTVEGVRLWPMVRMRLLFSIWADAFAANEGSAPATGRRLGTLAAGIGARHRAEHSDRQKRDSLGAPRDLVFLSDGISFAKVGEQQVERFCDPLIDLARQRGLTTQLWTPLHRYSVPRHSPSCFVQTRVDRANVEAWLLARLRPRIEPPEGLEEMRHELADQGLPVVALEPAAIALDALRIRRVARRYRAWLARAQPRAAYVVSYYSLEGMAFVRACRELRIPVTDLQHGVQGEWHAAYCGWGHIPSDACELLPDHFWVWSGWEARAIESSVRCEHACQPVVGGNPWVDWWRRSAAARQASQGVRRLVELAKGGAIVLVTLQYGLADELQIQPLQRAMQGPGRDLAWWIRLHPLMADRREEVRAKLGASLHGRAWLDEPSDLPLPALLDAVDVHVTHSSSAVIEAELAGVPSVLTSESGVQLFQRSVERGTAYAALSGSPEMLAAIRKAADQRRSMGPDRAPSSSAEGLVAAFERTSGSGNPMRAS